MPVCLYSCHYDCCAKAYYKKRVHELLLPGKLHTALLFVLLGLPEGAGATAPAGPAAPGGAAQDCAAAALLPGPAVQAAFPAPETGCHQDPGGHRVNSSVGASFRNQSYLDVKCELQG